MPRFTLIDTFPQFLAFWQKAQHQTLDVQIDGWAADYLAPWQELLHKQQADYDSLSENWRQVAKTHVFPYLAERLPEMTTAHAHLLALCETQWQQSQRLLGFEGDVTFMIYVGIGCGAGWVTQYAGKPAILLGLENIAECGWLDPDVLQGMLAHEMGHLAHFHWREDMQLKDGEGAMWQLYTEGFAQYCEQRIMGRESWHMGVDADWLKWCHQHRSWLAQEFLQASSEGQPVQAFFGSWHGIEGVSQSGYYLGCEVLKLLVQQMDLRCVALLTNWQSLIEQALKEISNT